MSTTPQAGPHVLAESPDRAAARSILLWISSQEDQDPEDRITALDALGALEDVLPADVVTAPIDERPGTLDDARDLLQAAAGVETTSRGLTSVHLALVHLRRRSEDR